MRLAVVSAAAVVLFAASPVRATSSVFCRTTDQPELELNVSVGHPPMAIGSASFNDGSGARSTGAYSAQIAIAQSWLDEEEFKLDLADRNVENFIVQLRTRRVRDGAYAGTMRYGKRTLKVSCRIDEEVE